MTGKVPVNNVLAVPAPRLELFPLSFARPKERGKEKGGSGELLPLEIYVRAGARCVTYAAKAAPTQLAFGSPTPSLICYGSELMPEFS